MTFPLDIWLSWLLPDDQPGDWYQWTVVAAGHVMLGAAAFVPLRLIAGFRSAWAICLGVYVTLELLQLAIGGSLVDGLTDALFVVGGMTMASEATKREPFGFTVVVVILTAAAMVGIGLRL